MIIHSITSTFIPYFSANSLIVLLFILLLTFTHSCHEIDFSHFIALHGMYHSSSYFTHHWYFASHILNSPVFHQFCIHSIIHCLCCTVRFHGLYVHWLIVTLPLFLDGFITWIVTVWFFHFAPPRFTTRNTLFCQLLLYTAKLRFQSLLIDDIILSKNVLSSIFSKEFLISSISSSIFWYLGSHKSSWILSFNTSFIISFSIDTFLLFSALNSSSCCLLSIHSFPHWAWSSWDGSVKLFSLFCSDLNSSSYSSFSCFSCSRCSACSGLGVYPLSIVGFFLFCIILAFILSLANANSCFCCILWFFLSSHSITYSRASLSIISFTKSAFLFSSEVLIVFQVAHKNDHGAHINHHAIILSNTHSNKSISTHSIVSSNELVMSSCNHSVPASHNTHLEKPNSQSAPILNDHFLTILVTFLVTLFFKGFSIGFNWKISHIISSVPLSFHAVSHIFVASSLVAHNAIASSYALWFSTASAGKYHANDNNHGFLLINHTTNHGSIGNILDPKACVNQYIELFRSHSMILFHNHFSAYSSASFWSIFFFVHSSKDLLILFSYL